MSENFTNTQGKPVCWTKNHGYFQKKYNIFVIFRVKIL